MSNYQKILDTKISFGLSYDGPVVKASFSISAEWKSVYNKTTHDHSIFTHAAASCEVYEIEVPTFEAVPLSDDFVAGVNYSLARGDWTKFVEIFGTHYIHDVVMGGRLEIMTDFSEHAVEEMQSLDIDLKLAASFSFAKFTANAEIDWHKH